jgi:hypothetical protein
VWRLVLHRQGLRVLREMEKQGMNNELIGAYDAGYTNAILQLRTHINSFVDKPNSQIKRVFELMDYMLDTIEEVKTELEDRAKA